MKNGYLLLISILILCINSTYSQTGTFGFTNASFSGENVVETISTTPSRTITVTGNMNNLNFLDAGGVYGTSGNVVYTSEASTTQMTLSFNGTVNITTMQAFEADGLITATWVFTPNTGTPKSISVAGNGTTVTLNFVGITSVVITRQGGGSLAFGFDTIVIDASLPVELVSFNARENRNSILLNWTTATEVNNYGFEIERKVADQEQENGKFEKIGFVNGAGNSNSSKSYSFTDNTLLGRVYMYRLKQIDNDGSYEYSKEIKVVLNNLPEYSLEKNYPNPFNPSTTIKYKLPVDSRVDLKIYDIMGREVKTLVNEDNSMGFKEVIWNGKNDRGELVTSGIYICRLRALPIEGGNVFEKNEKLVLMK
jgi:hypothetical protein